MIVIFYSQNFIYDNISSEEYDVWLVSESSDILNEYGINIDDKTEITLTFAYADEIGAARVWDNEMLEFFHSWMISDEYKRFISEDNEEIIYFLKGKSVVKRFTPNMVGLIDVTFELLSNYGYREQKVKISDTSKNTKIFNQSNLNKTYKPKITINNINASIIIISNLTTNKPPFMINNLTPNQVITIDNELGTIYDSNGRNLIVSSNRNWIELQKGSNEIHVIGNCTLTFESLYPVMI